MAESLLENVRRSSELVLIKAKHVQIDDAVIARLAEQLSAGDFTTELQNLPLRFDTERQHINFWAWVDLLSFGGSFHKEIQLAVDRKPSETILFGILGMYLTNPELSAEYMLSQSVRDVGASFGLPIEEEVPIAPAVYQMKDTVLKPLASLFHASMHNTATILAEQKLADLASFILRATSPSTNPTADALVAALVAAFPSLNDAASYEGDDVVFHRKAQQLAYDLYQRFKSTDAERFAFTDLAHLNTASEGSLVADLRRLGVLTATEELAATIAKGDEVDIADEIELRAGAVVATSRLRNQLAAIGKPHANHETIAALRRAAERSEAAPVPVHSNKQSINY